MDSLRDLAGRLDEAGGTLAGVARELAYAGPPETAFGVDAPGRLGEVGRALHEQWVAATDSRAREATTTADRLAATAAALRVAATGYADTDDAARRRHDGEA